MRKILRSWAFSVEPPIGIEPMTYALREAREYAAQPLPAQTTWRITLEALIALEFRGHSFHDPFHAMSAGRLLQPWASSGRLPVGSCLRQVQGASDRPIDAFFSIRAIT